MAVQVLLRRSIREKWGVLFLPGCKQEQSACEKCPMSIPAAGTICPVPASGTQQAGAFPWLSPDADVVAVVND